MKDIKIFGHIISVKKEEIPVEKQRTIEDTIPEAMANLGKTIVKSIRGFEALGNKVKVIAKDNIEKAKAVGKSKVEKLQAAMDEYKAEMAKK